MTSDLWHPRLRPDLQPPPPASSLHDPALQRELPLGPLTRAILAHSDGATPLPLLCEHVADATGADTETIHTALRDALRLALFDGAGADVARAVQRARDTPPPTVTRPGGRFDCVGAGRCCQVYRPGPLTDDDVARLHTAFPALRKQPLPPEPWIETHPGPHGEPWRYLRRTDHGCVFLRPDRSCTVHAVAGRDAKPEACRLFPFDARRTLRGLEVFDVAQCSALSQTAHTGPDHAHYAPEVQRHANPDTPLVHPILRLAPDVPCDFAFVLPWLDAATDAATGRVQPLATWAFDLADAHRSSPLTAHGPALPPPSLDPHARPLAPPLPDAARAVDASAAALEHALEHADLLDAHLADPFRTGLACVRALLAHRAGLADGLLPDTLQAARAVTPHPHTTRFLQPSLRNRLFAGRLWIDGDLHAGLARAWWVEALTEVLARLHAVEHDRTTTTPDGIDFAHWVAQQLLQRPPLARAIHSTRHLAPTLCAIPPEAFGP